MTPRPHSYLQEALTGGLHGLVLPVALLIAAAAALTHHLGFLVFSVALEGGFLLFYPRLPGFRRRCDADWRREDDDARSARFQRLAGGLSENARSRLRTLEQRSDSFLTQLRAMPGSASFVGTWSERLQALVEAGLRILLALDAVPVNPREAAADAADLAQLEQEIAHGHPGPALEARKQRLEMLRARVGRGPALAEQREAAVVQLDTLEDQLGDLSRAALEGRDAASFGARLEEVNALIAAARQSVAALEAHAAQTSALEASSRLTN